MSAQAIQPGRLIVRLDGLQGQERTAGYAVITNFIDEHAAITAALGGMRPAKVLVYLIIVAATVQKYMRNGVTGGMRGTQWFEEEDCGYISRRSVAEASGLPRENVRRIVRELIADGLVLENKKSGLVRQANGLVADPRTAIGLQVLIQRIATAAQRLMDLGLIEYSDRGSVSEPSHGRERTRIAQIA